MFLRSEVPLQALAAAWPLSALVWAPLGDFCVHAGLAVLFKCLIQMSVFASLVQHLLPAWYHPYRATSLIRNSRTQGYLHHKKQCLIQMSVFASLVQHLLPAWYFFSSLLLSSLELSDTTIYEP